MLALYKNVNILWKCWRFTKMLTLTLYEMSALYWNVGALWKSQRFMKMLALYTWQRFWSKIRYPRAAHTTLHRIPSKFTFFYSVHCTSSHLSAPGCLHILARVWDLGLGISQEIPEKCGAFISFLCSILFFKGAVSRTAFVPEKKMFSPLNDWTVESFQCKKNEWGAHFMSSWFFTF